MDSAIAGSADTADVKSISQDLLGFISRPRVIGAISWSSAFPTGKCLFQCDPLRTLLADDFIRAKLQGFKYIRAGVELSFRVSGNAFMGGKIFAVWIPPNKIPDYLKGMNLVQVSGIKQKVSIYPNNNSESILSIPINCPERMFEINDGATSYFDAGITQGNTRGTPFLVTTLGRVAVYVVAPLISQQEIDKCTITIYARFVELALGEAYFGGPTTALNPFPMTPVDLRPMPLMFTSTTRLAGYPVAPAGQMNVPIASEHGTLAEGEAKEKGPKLWKAASSLRSFMYNITPTASALSSVVVPVSTAAQFVLTKVEDVLKYFNLDKPLQRHLPDNILNRWRDITHGDGLEQANHLSLATSNDITPFGTNQPIDSSEYSISNICSIPQIVRVIQITTDQQAFRSIFTWRVAPWNVPATITNEWRTPSGYELFGASATCYPTYASFCSQAFKYWRGTCNIDIEIVAQSFSRMYIACVWTPGADEQAVDPVINGDTLPDTYSKIIEVSGNTTARFTIPMLTRDFWLNADPSCFEPSINGVLQVVIINPLTNYSPSGSSSNPVTAIISTSWEDLQFQRPSSNALVYAEPTTVRIVPQIEKIVAGAEEVPIAEEHGLMEDMFSGEDCDDIRQLIRRPGYYAYVDWTTANGQPSPANPNAVSGDERYCWFQDSTYSMGSWDSNNMIPLPRHDGRVYGTPYLEAANNFLSYFANLFVCAKGSIVYTFVGFSFSGNSPKGNTAIPYYPYRSGGSPEEGTFLASNASVPRMYNDGAFADHTATRDNNSINPSSLYSNGSMYRPISSPQIPATVSIPFYSNYAWVYTPTTFDLGEDVYVGNFVRRALPGVRIASTITGNASRDCLVNAGDSFAFSCLYPPSTSYFICNPNCPYNVELQDAPE